MCVSVCGTAPRNVNPETESADDPDNNGDFDPYNTPAVICIC